MAGGEDVWNRGLLRKGCGLCHGTAGSGYCLLEIYQATKDPKYLYRAFKVCFSTFSMCIFHFLYDLSNCYKTDVVKLLGFT